MTDVFLAAPTASEELRCMFVDACNRPTDIHQHLTVLRDTASGQRHITEMGVGSGQSTLAWLLVQPDKLVCYDLGWQDCVPALKRVKGRTDFRFLVGNSLYVGPIEETDLLFLDTNHNYGQVKEELRLHASRVRNYILLHDTTTFGEHSEDNLPPGMWRAIEEFMAENPWEVLHRHHHNNGLTILKRTR